MSYDLEAFRVPPGTTAREFYESDALGEDDSPPTPAEREEMERLAEALMAVDPAAERIDGADFIEIDTEAMQVSLYGNQAAITVPYWFQGGEADRVMTRAFEYAAVLAEVGGYTVFDPQTDEVVAGVPSADAKRVYASTSAMVDEIAREESAEPAPRWKFWKRR